MQTMYAHVSLVLVLTVSFAWGYEYPKACPVISPKDVDITKYAGTWYDVMHTQPEAFSCSKNVYTFSKNSGEDLMTVGFHYRLHNGTVLDETSGLYRVPPTTQGVFQDETQNGKSIGNLYVLDIVYNKYAVEYLCSYEDGKINEIVIFSTKDGTLSEDLKKKLLKVLTDNNISAIPVDEQQGCVGL